MATENQILEESLYEFKESHSFLYSKFQDIKCEDVKRYILAMQDSQDRLKALRNFSRIGPSIEAFETFGQIARLTGAQAACIWGPIKYILQTAKDEHDAFEDVLHSYHSLGSRVPDIQPYTDMITEKAEAKRCLAWMYGDILQFQKLMLRLLNGHGWKVTFHVNWKDSQDEFSTVLRTFELHAQTLEKMLLTYQRQVSNDVLRRLNDHTQTYHDDRLDLEIHIRQYEEDRAQLLGNAKLQEQARKDQQMTAVTRWFAAPVNIQIQLHRSFEAIRSEFKGTTDWIKDHVEISNWVCTDLPPQAVLWINGKKGAGKTILTSEIIEYCKTSRQDFRTSYFYCREGDSSQNTCLAVYKSLLNQMLSHHREMLPYCDEKRLKVSSEVLGDENTARLLVERFCDAELNQFIVIDGLDEIDLMQRRLLIQFLAAMVRKCDQYNPGKLRILFVSHDLPDMRRMKCLESTTILELDPDDTQKAIKLFVDMKLVVINEKFGMKNEDLERARKMTIDRSDGMFLYASLVMENLLNQPTVNHLNQQLLENIFPKDLKEAYKSIIDRLRCRPSENQWPMAKKVFGWLACAKRPLNWYEIQAALSMQISNEEHPWDMDFYGCVLRDDPRELCGSLVQRFGDRIVFTHQTVRQYIVQSEELDERSIECDLAVICISYLSSPWFDKAIEENARNHYAKQGYYSFQDYALTKWDHHLKAFVETGAAVLNENTNIERCHRISNVLSTFAQKYKDDIFMPPNEERDLRVAQECSMFRGYGFYQDLVLIWKHLHARRGDDHKQRNKVSIGTLESALRENRKQLEKVAMSNMIGSDAATFKERYGKYPFKCDRLLCDWFYRGFEDADGRDNHLKRHDRPYRCPVPDCSIVEFGFSTNKDREKHIRAYHPDDAAVSGFVQLPRELIEDARFDCEICGNLFTRKANRDAHVRSHYGERPHECPTCGRAFTRANDLRRHERNKHVRRRG